MNQKISFLVLILIAILAIGVSVYLSYPLWKEEFFTSSDSEKNEAMSSCEKDGGKWFGFYECEGENCGACARETSDYGKTCNTNLDCQGFCEATTGKNNETIGTCTKYDRFTGVSMQLYNNGEVNTLVE